MLDTIEQELEAQRIMDIWFPEDKIYWEELK